MDKYGTLQAGAPLEGAKRSETVKTSKPPLSFGYPCMQQQ